MSTKPAVKKCVLAYSGGLDTSIIVPWLKNNYNCEVICFCANLGQADELEGLEAKALASGASKCYVFDLREERSEEHTSELQSQSNLVCRLLLEKKKKKQETIY